ncbi:MAG: twin-arginine translocase subunit TatC [Nitrososphaerales archaeon]|jgi:sec-independent protein translocase protein TatC
MSSEPVMSLREHLNELKSRFKVAFTSFVIILAALLVVPADPQALISQGYLGFLPLVAFFIARIKLDLLPPGWTLIAGGGLNEPLEIYLVAAVLFALIFNGPIFAYEVIRYIGPALNENERGLVYPFVFAATGLFAFGVVFGYLFLAKFLLLALTPFFVTTGIQPFVDAGSFYFVVMLTIGMSGFAFTIPVYVYTLIVLGVIKATSFTHNRLIIWAITYILTAIITPDGGPLLDVILFVPIITLLELAVFIGGRQKARSDRKKAAAEAASSGTSAAAPPPSSSSPPSSPSTGAPALPAPATTTTTAATSTQRVCSYCKNPLAPGVVFCPNCGRSNS